MLVAAPMLKRRFGHIAVLVLSIIWSLAVHAAEAPYVVVILVDGARGDLVHELAAAGKLPNIQKLFIDGGLDVEHATTVFPTTSTNAYQSFMTGLFPGHAGIPYLARFSRSEKKSIEYLSLKGVKILNADLLNWYQLNDPDIPYRTAQSSLFDELGDLHTSSIYATFQRDTTIQKPYIPFRAAWNTFVLGNHEALDELAYQQLTRIFEGPQDKIPHLNFVALLSTDVLAHLEGSHAPRVLNHFETIDRMIGDFETLLTKRGLADKTYIVLVGDHGNHDISERSYLRERLIKQGVAIRSRHIRPPYELAINARGVSCAIISVAGPSGWKTDPSLDDLRQVPTLKKGDMDLIDYLRNQPETDLLLVRNNMHHVRIFSASSESEITQFWSSGRFWYSYRVLNGTDPMHYMDDPKISRIMTAQTPLTADQWLPLTATKEYGDAIVQIGQIFTDGRVGDMIIIPKKEWVFRHEKANTHGSISQDDMHIPIMIHGPTIAPQKIPYGRSVDVMPTILSWFGRKIPQSDGQNLLRPRPVPTRAEVLLATRELAAITHPHHARSHPSGEGKRHSAQLSTEFEVRKARVTKLNSLSDRCQTKKVEDRLTRPDRPKKMRISTCEVVDLALKTAYEDLQRLEFVRGKPVESPTTADKTH